MFYLNTSVANKKLKILKVTNVGYDMKLFGELQ